MPTFLLARVRLFGQAIMEAVDKRFRYSTLAEFFVSPQLSLPKQELLRKSLKQQATGEEISN